MSADRTSESGAMTTREVILTLALVLGAGLVAEVVADLTRLPRMIFLLLAGTLLGPSVAGLVDIPLDSVAAELTMTLGVSVILFHGSLDLSLDVLRKVALGLGLLVLPGVLLTAAICGTVAAAVFGVARALVNPEQRRAAGGLCRLQQKPPAARVPGLFFSFHFFSRRLRRYSRTKT